MSQEIIYTSAPAGLKPGSRGFCTVVATHGMVKSLADQLEDLSGYRHLFLSGPEAATNPVVYSHLRVPVGGRTFHVLSRIADAGLDYTQRTNKLAHHVALDPGELPPAGPAWLMSHPGWMATSWSGAPQARAKGPVVPAGNATAAPCRAWQRAAGDAGWAGVVAAELLGDSRRQIVVVYRPGQEMLPLVAEVLALLPAERRWSVTFSTFFTKLAPTIDCRWRCYVEGTPEAESGLRHAGALVLDLRQPLGKPDESPYVAAARAGKKLSLPRLQARPAAEAEQVEQFLAADRKAREAKHAAAAEQKAVVVAVVQPIWEPEPVLANAPPLPAPPPARSSLLLVLCCVVGLAMIGAAAGFWWMEQQARLKNRPPQAVAAPTGENNPQPIAEAPELAPPPKASTSTGTATAGTAAPMGKAVDDDHTATIPGTNLPPTALASGSPPTTNGSAAVLVPGGPAGSATTQPAASATEVETEKYVGSIGTTERTIPLPKEWMDAGARTLQLKPLLPFPTNVKQTQPDPNEPLVLKVTGGIDEPVVAKFSLGPGPVLNYKPLSPLKDIPAVLDALPYSILSLKSASGDEKLVAFWDIQTKPPITLSTFMNGKDDDPAKTFEVPEKLATNIRLEGVLIEGDGVVCEEVSRAPWRFLVKVNGGSLTVQVDPASIPASVVNGKRRVALRCSIGDAKLRDEFRDLAISNYSLGVLLAERGRLIDESKTLKPRISNLINDRNKQLNNKDSNAESQLKSVNAEIARLEKLGPTNERKLSALGDAYLVLSSPLFQKCRLHARACVMVMTDDRTAAIAEF